jgi:hypothetical protein
MERAGAKACVLMQEAMGVMGPLQTFQNIQIIDFKLLENSIISFDKCQGLDMVMLYI